MGDATRRRNAGEVAEWRPDQGEDNAVLIGNDAAKLERLRVWLRSESQRASLRPRPGPAPVVHG